MKRVLSIFAVVLYVSTTLVTTALVAQKKTREERREEATTRSALGLVTGPDDAPLSGAVVQVKDMRTLQVRSFITQNDGAYHFSGLKNDTDYQLSAKSGEMTAAPRTLSIFDNRREAVMNFKLEKK